MSQRDEAAIRGRAYQLWALGGYIDGHHDHHWRQAERELGGEPAKPDEGAAAAEPGPRVDGISSLPGIEGTDAPPRRGGR